MPAAARTPPGDPKRLPVSYIWESGELFLRTREALDTNTTQRVEAYAGPKALAS